MIIEILKPEEMGSELSGLYKEARQLLKKIERLNNRYAGKLFTVNKKIDELERKLGIYSPPPSPKAAQ